MARRPRVLLLLSAALAGACQPAASEPATAAPAAAEPVADDEREAAGPASAELPLPPEVMEAWIRRSADRKSVV